MADGSASLRGRNLGVLISGRGSNLQALIDATADGRLHARLRVVISNRAGAQGIDRARAAGIETIVVRQGDYPSRDAFDAAIAAELRSRSVDLVCLAGFMRLIGPSLLHAFPDAILNIHPSLLPAFPGVGAQAQALAYGVKVTGVTVHLVTEQLDGGPIVLQRVVPVEEGDTEEALSARILEQEHLAYPEAVRLILDGGWRVEGRRFRLRPVTGSGGA